MSWTCNADNMHIASQARFGLSHQASFDNGYLLKCSHTIVCRYAHLYMPELIKVIIIIKRYVTRTRIARAQADDNMIRKGCMALGRKR